MTPIGTSRQEEQELPLKHELRAGICWPLQESRR